MTFFLDTCNMFACTFDSGMTFLLLDLLSRMGIARHFQGTSFSSQYPALFICSPSFNCQCKVSTIGHTGIPRYVVLQFLAKRQEL